MFDQGGFDSMMLLDGGGDEGPPGSSLYTWKQAIAVLCLYLLGLVLLAVALMALCHWTGGTECCPFCGPDHFLNRPIDPRSP